MSTKTKKIQVLMSEAEFEAFKAYAKTLDMSMSDILRKHVQKILKLW